MNTRIALAAAFLLGSVPGAFAAASDNIGAINEPPASLYSQSHRATAGADAYAASHRAPRLQMTTVRPNRAERSWIDHPTADISAE